VRVERREPPHRPVAHDLRDDGRCRDRRALLVPVDDRAVLRRRRAEPEAVDEADLRRRRELRQDRPHRGEVRPMQPVGVDLAGRDRAHRDPLRAADHGAKQRLTARRRQLLRIVEERERPDTVVAKARVVEQDTGDDERPG
jgi:hypothetical protein